MSVAIETIGAESSMQEVLEAFPGARRALFRRYHIGGCSSCGFEMSETSGALCQRNGGLNVGEVVEHIRTSHEQDKQMEIAPKDVAERRQRGETVRLLDIRTREEWDAVKIEGAEFVNQELVQSLMGKAPREALLVFYDHDGSASLDAVAYFAGHGFVNAKYMRGGIDGWSRDVDSNVPRYRLQKS